MFELPKSAERLEEVCVGIRGDFQSQTAIIHKQEHKINDLTKQLENLKSNGSMFGSVNQLINVISEILGSRRTDGEGVVDAVKRIVHENDSLKELDKTNCKLILTDANQIKDLKWQLQNYDDTLKAIRNILTAPEDASIVEHVEKIMAANSRLFSKNRKYEIAFANIQKLAREY